MTDKETTSQPVGPPACCSSGQSHSSVHGQALSGMQACGSCPSRGCAIWMLLWSRPKTPIVRILWPTTWQRSVPVCGDATIVPPLHLDGSPWRGAADSDGLRLHTTRKRKETCYAELVRGERGRLVLLGSEVGGRSAPEALRLLSRMAIGRADQTPALLRASARFAWHRRWLCAISVTVHAAFAASLAEPAALQTVGAVFEFPSDAEVLCDWRAAPTVSRLPLR